MKDDPNCEGCTEDCGQCAADAGVIREENYEGMKMGSPYDTQKNASRLKKSLTKTTKPEMRSFEGGATRNTDAGKIDYEGFLSPFALKVYCEYLDSHRVQADGKLRDSDNWQGGFGPGVCMKSLLRHVWDAWMIHRGGGVIEDGKAVSKKEALCAAAFNIFSQLHDMEKPQDEEPPEDEPKPVHAQKQNWAKCRSLGKRLCESCYFDALDGCSLKVCSYRVRASS